MVLNEQEVLNIITMIRLPKTRWLDAHHALYARLQKEKEKIIQKHKEVK